MLLALDSLCRGGSATTQSSLHQPGSSAASSQSTTAGWPSGVKPSMRPASISTGVHAMGDPPLMVRPPLTKSLA